MINSSSMADANIGSPSLRGTQVLIVGAGPTGLVLALWLTRLGVRVRIIDKAEQPGTTWVFLERLLSPSDPILITDLADLSIGEVDLEHVFR